MLDHDLCAEFGHGANRHALVLSQLWHPYPRLPEAEFVRRARAKAPPRRI